MANGTDTPAGRPRGAMPVSMDPTGAFARAKALEERGQVAEAEGIYRSLLRLYPDHPSLLESLALALKGRGQLGESETLMRHAIALRPADASFHNNLGNLLRIKGNLAEAQNCYLKAISVKPDYPEAHYNLGIVLNELGRGDDSLSQFQFAVSQNPNYVQAITCVGAHYYQRSAFEEALSHLDAALALQSDYFDANYYRGLTLSGLERYADALAALERAIAVKPNSAQALANLALIAARQSDLSRARECAARALALNPEQAIAEVALAMSDLAEEKFGETEQRLRMLLEGPRVSGNLRAFAFGLLGDTLDGQDKITEAYRAYTSENSELIQLHSAKYGSGSARAQVEQLIQYYERARTNPWSPPSDQRSADGSTKQHVFLVGFMRSGTTLMEQVLAANPEIVTLEERDTFGETAAEFFGDAAGLDRLAALDGEELVRHREAYWQRVRNFGLDVAGKVLINKHPLNTIKLPLIAKMFPKAKILFAVRDPRDVVFSCYRRHFGMNAATYELLTLEGAASFYDRVMRLAKMYRAQIPFDFHFHRYEDMVSDFETNMRNVCQFIGVGWAPAMMDFADLARTRAIRSVSAAQVRRGLYREGVDQWRRYAKELAPVLPILNRWVEEFGYSQGG